MDSRTPDRADSRAHPLSGLERAALDHIPAMVGYWDRHLRNRLANAAYTDWFGLGPEQLQGIHLSDLLGEEPYAQTLPSVRAVLAGKPQLFRRTMTNAGGETREFQVSYVPDGSAARVPGFFVLVTDITRRALAERRERESADRYRALARSVPGVFVLLFDADLRYIIAEGQELATFGHRQVELEGRTIHEALDPGLAEELEPRYRAALGGHERTWKRTIGHRTFTLTAAPVRSGDAITAGIVVAVDVTDRLQREQTWAALHDIATAVARSAAPADIAERVASVLQDLFLVDVAAVVRFSGTGTAEIVAMAPALPGALSRLQTFGPADMSAAGQVALTGKPALVNYAPSGGLASEQLLAVGFHAGAAAPIRVHGELWGAISLASTSAAGVTPAMLERLAEFAELVEIAIGNSEAWSTLELQASTDGLTGLPNRRAFEERLASETARAAAVGGALSAVVLDIDHFKRVNDGFGHPVGDTVLVEVAARLKRVAREGEMMARLGGEEFVWLLPGTTGGHALQAAERARAAVATAAFGDVGWLTVSAGVCELGDSGNDGLVACADEALYAAKRTGRNRSQRYGASAG
ncbi:diguanylate cyclase [Paenarthrobacter sp. DKR-5]|uniref:sensor domain-containing diguanylate cyclase n=1 Tax=Paenarthrobacter sp. DKR-5 TaxID=2835535 RepID=UPI001BDD50C4|nr:diguanylate cyclase [Paenarthrobacter sp. DKR-5]MBT1003800.1 diguanylate cyclase [Paenarthrobacter sp. DKR-5]